MSLSTVALVTCRIPPVTGECGSLPNASKVTWVNRLLLVLPLPALKMKEKKQPLLQESSSNVSSRREMMHLTAISLCFASLFLSPSAEALGEDVKDKIMGKVDELKGKAGGSVEDLKGKADNLKGKAGGSVNDLKGKAGGSFSDLNAKNTRGSFDELKGKTEGQFDNLKEKAGMSKAEYEGNKGKYP